MNLRKLLVADDRAGRTYAVADGTVGPLGNAVLAERVGVLTLPRRGEGRSERAFADQRTGSVRTAPSTT